METRIEKNLLEYTEPSTAYVVVIDVYSAIVGSNKYSSEPTLLHSSPLLVTYDRQAAEDYVKNRKCLQTDKLRICSVVAPGAQELINVVLHMVRTEAYLEFIGGKDG